MKQRIAALMVVCILALSVPAYSADNTKIRALYREPEIKVYVPSSAEAGELILNPRRLPVKVAGKVSSDEIINTPWTIENQSNVAIAVDAKVSAKVARRSKMELAEQSVKKDKSGYKMAFMFLDTIVTDPDMVVGELDWSSVYNAKKHLVITTSVDERANIMKLAAANEDGTTADGGVGAFHIGGDVAPKPEDDWNPAVDALTITVTLTFRPTTPET